MALAVFADGLLDLFFIFNTGRDKNLGWIFRDETDGVMVEDDVFGIFPKQTVFATAVSYFDKVFGDLETTFTLDGMIFIDLATDIKEIERADDEDDREEDDWIDINYVMIDEERDDEDKNHGDRDYGVN